jgi:hypothetical protein
MHELNHKGCLDGRDAHKTPIRIIEMFLGKKSISMRISTDATKYVLSMCAHICDQGVKHTWYKTYNADATKYVLSMCAHICDQGVIHTWYKTYDADATKYVFSMCAHMYDQGVKHTWYKTHNAAATKYVCFLLLLGVL